MSYYGLKYMFWLKLASFGKDKWIIYVNNLSE